MTTLTSSLTFQKLPQKQHDGDFRTALEALAVLVKSEGLGLRAYADPMLPIFSNLDLESQRIATKDARDTFELWAEAKREEGRVSSSKQLLWRFFSRTGIRPPSDLFDRIEDSWLVEIYNRESLQMFRSFELFKFTSFTLEELLCIPWWKRYRRLANDDNYIAGLQAKLLGGEITGAVLLPSRPHVVEEVGSAEELVFDYDAKLMAPLFKNDEVVGFLAAVSAVPVGKAKP